MAMTEPDFLKLFVKNQLALRAYARAILPDWDLVDEALQEASVTLWQKRDQLQDEDGFLPWAKVILRFKCLRQLEKIRSRRSIVSESMLDTLASRAERQPVEATARREAAFRDCLGRFSNEDRELLLAPHSSTYSVVELAERREKSANALYKTLGRLRQRLSDCIRTRTAAEATP